MTVLRPGGDIYDLRKTYLDQVDFYIDTMHVTPIKRTLPQNDFESQPTPFPDSIIARKYIGEESWRVGIRFRQLGGDPKQVGTHWDRIWKMEQYVNDFRVDFLYVEGTDELITDGDQFPSTPGIATSPELYTVVNSIYNQGTHGVREGTNTYVSYYAYDEPGIFWSDEIEEESVVYFNANPSNGTDDDVPSDPPPDFGDPPPDTGGPEDPDTGRTPGRDHADENLSVASVNVPDPLPNDLREVYTLLANDKDLDLVIAKQLLKEARFAEKHYYDLLAQDFQNAEYDWNWSKAVHRVKTHAKALSGKQTQLINQFKKTPNVAILDRGYSKSAAKLLRKLGIPSVFVQTDFSPSIVEDHPILYIPSAGLYGMDRSDIFRARLEEYTQNGGTIISLTQQHGTDFEILPGGELTGYGWLEDGSCHSKSLAITSLHPVIHGQDEAILDAGVDGFFTGLPPDTEVIMRRTKNDMPAAVVYPFGNGQVMAVCLYSDWISGLGGETADDRALLADMVHWADNPQGTIPEVILGEATTIPITLSNSSIIPVEDVRIIVRRPDGTIFAEETRDDIILAAGTSTTIDFTVPGAANPDVPGIWRVEYVLLNYENDFFREPEIQWHTLGTRFIVKADIEAITAVNDYNFYITSSQETYFKGQTGTFVFHVQNNTTVSQEFEVFYTFPHHLWEVGGADRSRYGDWPYTSSSLNETITVDPGQEASFAYSVDIQRNDRLHAALFVNSEQVRFADRQIMTSRATHVVDVTPENTVYEGGAVSLALLIHPRFYSPMNGEAVLTVRDPNNGLVHSETFPINVPANTIFSQNAGFDLGLFPLPGYYTNNLEFYNTSGERIGSDTSFFEVPDRSFDSAITIPAAIDILSSQSYSLAATSIVDTEVTDCTVTLRIIADNQTLFEQSKIVPVISPGATVTTDFDVDLSGSTLLGLHTVQNETSCSTPAVSQILERQFYRSFAYHGKLDKAQYYAGEEAEFTVTFINTGISNESIDYQGEIASSGISFSDTIVLPASGTVVRTYPFTVPDLGSGDSYISSSLTNFPGMEQNTLLFLRHPEVTISFPDTPDTSQATIPIDITSENIQSQLFASRLIFKDSLGSIFFEESAQFAMDSSTPTTLDAPLPKNITSGSYSYSLIISNPANGQVLKIANKPIQINDGIEVTLVSTPDAEAYNTGDSGTIATDVTLLNRSELENASLEVSVASTVDPNEFIWKKDLGGLSKREDFKPWDTASVAFINLVDLDNDGDMDMVTSPRADDSLSIFFENQSVAGSMEWVYHPEWQSGWPATTYSVLGSGAFGDLDGDGDHDFIGMDSGVFKALEFSGTHQAPAWTANTAFVDLLPILSSSAPSLQLEDIDRDGDLDLFLGGSALQAQFAYRNDDITDSDATLDGPVWVEDTNVLLAGVAKGELITFVDLNVDGRKDIIYFDSFNSANTYNFYLNLPGAPDPTVIVWEHQVNETINATNNATGNRWGFKTILPAGTNFNISTNGAYDLDRDGLIDFLSINPTTGYIRYYENTPASPDNSEGVTQYFETQENIQVVEPHSFPATSFPVDWSLADINNDGIEELISTMVTLSSPGSATSSQKALVYENTGSEAEPFWGQNTALTDAFNVATAYSRSYDAGYDQWRDHQGLCLVDLDGDDLKDALTYSGTTLSAYMNLGGANPNFTAAAWMASVQSTIPKHYLTIPNRTPTRTDYGFHIDAKDFDNDGDQDIFISYSWKAYSFSSPCSFDYQTFGGFVAYENTGDITNPVYSRKTTWGAGLNQKLLKTYCQNNQYSEPPEYAVELVDLDGDGTFEALVGKSGTNGTGFFANGISAFRYDGSAWVLDDTLKIGLTMGTANFGPKIMPAILDLDNDNKPDLLISSDSGEKIEKFGMHREATFQETTTTTHTISGSLSHDTLFASFPVAGRMELTSRLKSEYGQVLTEYHDEFYVLGAGQTVLVELAPDKDGYKAGEMVQLTGRVKNMGDAPILGTLSISNRDTGEILHNEADITIQANAELPYTVQAGPADTEFYALASFNTFETFAPVKLVTPELNIAVEMVAAVNNAETVDAQVNIVNPTTIPISVQMGVEGETDDISLAPFELISINKTFPIDSTKTFTFEFTGDYEETIQKSVSYEQGATVSFHAQTMYPEGNIIIPYTVSNTGTLSDTFSLVFSGAVNRTIDISSPPGTNKEHILQLTSADLGLGDQVILWESHQESGEVAFRIVDYNDISIESLSYTGVEGDETSGLMIGFDYSFKNQGLTDFTGEFLLELPGVAKKTVPLLLAMGEETTLHLTFPAPTEYKTYTCKGSVFSGADMVVGANLTFKLQSGIEAVVPFQSVDPGQPGNTMTFPFVIINNGEEAEDFNATFTFPFGASTNNTQSGYLAKNEQTSLSFTDFLPDDVAAGTYKAELSVNGKIYVVPFQVNGLDLTAVASLDKDVYLADGTDTCTMTLAVSSNNGTFNGKDLYALASYNGNQQRVDFTLQDSNTITFDFDVSTDNGRINWGIYQDSGRSIVLNDILMRTVDTDFSIAADKSLYDAGDTAVFPIISPHDGILTLTIPALDWKQTQDILEGQSLDISVPLAPDLTSGTYVMIAVLESAGETITKIIFFDVRGITVRPIGCELDKEKYLPTDNIEGLLNLESNISFNGKLIAVVRPERGIETTLYEGAVSVSAGTTQLPFDGQFKTVVSGTHFVHITVVNSSDPDIVYTSYSKAFDVGGIVLLDASTPESAYSSNTTSVVLTLRAFGTEPGMADIFINGVFYDNVLMTPHSVVEANVEIQASEIPAGEVVIEAIMIVEGLKSSKQTAFVFGDDLPDLVPNSLRWNQGVSTNMLSGTVKNQGKSRAQQSTLLFYLGDSDTGTLLETFNLENIDADETVTVEFDPGESLIGKRVTMVVELQSGKEFNITNNVFTKFFDTINHMPAVTSLRPDSDEPLNNPHTFSWVVSDEDNDPYTVAIYLDTDLDPDNGRIFLDSAPATTDQASMDTTQVPLGDYYVSLTVTDSKGAYITKYSDGKLINGDRDGDNVLDHSDNCLDTPNPDQLDDDNDTIGDACDEFPGDHDNDGLTDLREIELGTDINNPDTDGDGFSDGDEVAWGSDPKSKDGVPHISGNILLPDNRPAPTGGVLVEIYSATVNSTASASSIWVAIPEGALSAPYTLNMPSDFSLDWYVGYKNLQGKGYINQGFYTEQKTVPNFSDVQYLEGGFKYDKINMTLLLKAAEFDWNLFLPAIIGGGGKN